MSMVTARTTAGSVNREDEVKETADEEAAKPRSITRERRVGRRSLVLNSRLRGEQSRRCLGAAGIYLLLRVARSFARGERLSGTVVKNGGW